MGGKRAGFKRTFDYRALAWFLNSGSPVALSPHTHSSPARKTTLLVRFQSKAKRNRAAADERTYTKGNRASCEGWSCSRTRWTRPSAATRTTSSTSWRTRYRSCVGVTLVLVACTDKSPSLNAGWLRQLLGEAARDDEPEELASGGRPERSARVRQLVHRPGHERTGQHRRQVPSLSFIHGLRMAGGHPFSVQISLLMSLCVCAVAMRDAINDGNETESCAARWSTCRRSRPP